MKTKNFGIFVLLLLAISIPSAQAKWYGNHPTATPATAAPGSATNCGVDAQGAEVGPNGAVDPMLPGDIGGTVYNIQARVRVTGNPMTCQYWDNTAPVVASNSGSALWRKTPITNIKLTATDYGGSNTAIRKYRWDAAATRLLGVDYVDNAIITMNMEGDHTLYLYVEDGATAEAPNIGNSTAQSFTGYKLDMTNPTASASGASLTWHNAPFNIFLHANDPQSIAYPTATPSTVTAALGIRKYVWRYDNMGVVPTLATCLAGGTTFNDGDIFPLSREGDHTLYVCSQDVAGNQSPLWSGTYRLDTTAPTAGATNDSTIWKNAPINLVLHATDPVSITDINAAPSTVTAAGGIHKYVWHYNHIGVAPTLATCLAGGTTFNDGDPHTLSVEGDHTLYICSQDEAGNQSLLWSGIYRLDTTLPTGTINYFNGWTNVYTGQTLDISPTDPIPGAGIIISDLSGYTIQVSESAASPNFPGGTWSVFADLPECTNHNPATDCLLNDLTNHHAYQYRVVIQDHAGNIFTGSSLNILKIDTTPPTLADVSNINPTNYLANTYTYDVNVDVNLGSPISIIEANSENFNTLALPDFRSVNNSSLLSFAWDMHDVDSDRLAGGGRQYTFNLTRIRDEAGNEWNGVDPKINTVYANTKDPLSVKQVISEQLSNPANVADGNGSTKNLILQLMDIHGNAIIKAPDITRTIDFNFDVTNTMHRNQFTRLGADDSVFLNRTTDGTFMNRLTNNASFDDEVSGNGIYTYGFQVYTPTSNQNAIYGPVSDPAALFNINSITYDINNGTPILAGDSPQAQPFGGLPITSHFDPLFYTNITGDLRNGGFIEGTEQTSSVQVTKNAAIVTAGDTLSATFGGPNSAPFRFYASTSSPPSNEILAGMTIHSVTPFPDNIGYITQLVQRPGFTVNNLSDFFTSTHLTYIINGKSVTTNSDIIGKTSFHDVGPAPLVGNQVGIRILGSAGGNNINAIVTDQFGTGVSIFKSTDRSLIRQEIKKNIAIATRNATMSTVGNTVSDLNGLPGGAGAVGTLIGQPGNKSIMLIEQNGGNITLDINIPAASKISGIRTLVVRGANLYIKKDMYYDPLTPSIFGVVVEKDANGNGGNLYIDPSVTNVVGTYIMDGSVMSYDSVKGILGSTGSIADLKNQLYIYGTIVSENTIGGSRQNPPKCPNLLDVPCANVADSQKYDLNYLRRYYITALGEPFGGAKVIGGGNCPLGACTAGNPSFIHKFGSMTDEFAKYPTIIEFNPKIQSITPVGFDKLFQE